MIGVPGTSAVRENFDDDGWGLLDVPWWRVAAHNEYNLCRRSDQQDLSWYARALEGIRSDDREAFHNSKLTKIIGVHACHH